MDKIYTIDAHSHIGHDAFFPNIGTKEQYIKMAQEKGINEVYVMPVGCPIISNGDKTETLSYYEFQNGEIKYYHIIEDKGIKVYKRNEIGHNPYAKANDRLYHLCQIKGDITFNYVPLIHPIFYSIEDFKTHIKRGAKLFKIHGIACGVDPRKINPEFYRILESFSIPILIHTDYSPDENILSINSAYNWLTTLQKYNIKVYIAHATRLNKYSIDLVNKDSRYVIGLGPDMMLNLSGMNEIETENYLEYVLKTFNEDKIIFDIDYPWNTKSKEDYSLDWLSKDRICSIIKDQSTCEKILSKNINRFIGGNK